MKFGTYSKLNMLIINAVPELMILTQDYRFGQIYPKIEMCAMFKNFDTQN